MFGAFKSISIGVRLPMVVAGLTIAGIIATSAVNYQGTRSAILHDAEARMLSIKQLQTRSIATFFDNLDRDLALRAESQLIVNAITEFTDAFAAYTDPVTELQKAYITDNPHPNGQKDAMITSGLNDAYDRLHNHYHPDFDALQDANGYYDVFLFDTEGNLIYSVFKELDYATNMNTGQWRESGLATVFTKAMQASADSPTVFDDFKPYEPSYGAPAAFFARPVFNAEGSRIGVLAYQAPIDAINATMTNIEGLGQTGEAMLLGADLLMRNDAERSADNDILVTKLENDAVLAALDGESGVDEFTDSWGELVLAAYGPIDLFGESWAIIVKQNKSEVLAPVEKALWQTVTIAAIAMAMAVLVALIFARGISGPLVALNAAVQKIAQRNYDLEVPATQRGDEVGRIAQAMEDFRVSLESAETAAVETAFKGAAFEVSGGPIMITDLNFNVLQVNGALTRMMKDRHASLRSAMSDFDPEDIVGRSMHEFYAFPQKVRDFLKAPKEFPLRTKIAISDAYFGLLIDEVTDSDGVAIGYVLDWKDQTYQMQSQSLMQAIDAGQGRVEFTADREIKAANASFVSLVGLPPSEIEGLSCAGAIEPLTNLGVSDDVWTHVLKGNSVFDSFRVSLGSNDMIVQGSLSPTVDHEGNTNGSILLCSDITKQHLEAEAIARRERDMAAAQDMVVAALQSNLTLLSEGDLSKRIEQEFSEDYENLRKNYNAAVRSLGSAIKNVLETAQSIQGDTEEVSAATDDLSQRTESQATTLEQTSIALNELSKLVNAATNATTEVTHVVKSARENAEKGSEVVREAVSAMTEIEVSSNEITSIISVIDQIAFQTNLLALNAGVEAARAGDAGRGFAVVASEVRELAQRSSDAASKISTLITSSGEQVRRGVSLVGETGAALTQIVESVIDISNQVDEIAKSSSEQSSGIGEINEAVADLNLATQKNTAMVEETTAVSRSLKQQAMSLVESTARFTVSPADNQVAVETAGSAGIAAE